MHERYGKTAFMTPFEESHELYFRISARSDKFLHESYREVEVLKLVVSGKSNSRIAQELVISEKTVINHLTHIFNKTNCENRAAATAFAIRHGLA